MTDEEKDELFLIRLAELNQRKLKEKKELERKAKIEKENKIKEQIFKDRLASRVSGSILKDFMTLRF